MAYDKFYSRTNWEDEPSTSTPLSAHYLNKIEVGMDEADDRIVAISKELEELKKLLVDGNEVKY